VVFGKSRDATPSEKKNLANEYRHQAVEAEVNATGKSAREVAEAKSRADSMRDNANKLDPDKS
jgi:hypothetical protein